MPMTTNHPLSEVYLTCYSPAVGSGSISAFLNVPFRGRIKRLGLVVNKAVATSTLLVSTYVNGTAITGGGITLAVAGSTSGSTAFAVPTGANWVNEGDVIGFVPSVAAGTSVAANFFAVVKRG